MIRKIGAALAVAAGALAATGVAAPASASQGNYTIETGDLVVWRDTNFTGPAYDYDASNVAQYGQLDQPDGYAGQNGAFRIPVPNQPNVYTYSKVDDAVSSIANYDISDYIRAWTGASSTGTYFQILPYGYTSGSLSWSYSSLGSFDNQLSSHQIAGSPTP